MTTFIDEHKVDEYLTRLRQGDSSALDLLYNASSKQLYSICYSYLHDPHDSADALSDTFLAIVKNIEKYRGEAYAYSSTMLGNENEKFGQACVSQVTGTAAWMDVVATQYLLGIRPVAKGLVIDPCIPSEWKGFRVKRSFRGCELDIRVENPLGVQKGVKKLYFNGVSVNVSDLSMIDGKRLQGKQFAQIKVVMG